MHRYLLSAAALLTLAAPLAAQNAEGERIAEARRFLADTRDDLKRSYYDKTYHGLDVDALYDSARVQLDHAASDQERYRAIERFLERFGDSHTFFIAPLRVGLNDYSFGMRFFGDALFVTHVNPASQADSAGLRKGDEVVAFSGKPLTRANYGSTISEFLGQHPIQPLELTVRSADRSQSTVTLRADTTAIYKMKGAQFRRLLNTVRDSVELASSHQQASVADSIFVWRLPQFTHSDKGLDDVMKRVRKHAVLVLDLRGNGGGSVATLTRLLSNFVDQETVVGDLHTRVGAEKFVAKPRKDRFTGRTFILVNSETGSAAEIFARIMQLQGKAQVFGDRTAGAVMASNIFAYSDYAGASITVSDFVLYNGERLEKVGVTPDVLAVESAAHIAAGVDPVLSLALLRAGARVAPATAARIFGQSGN